MIQYSGLEMEKSQKGGKSESKRRKFCEPSQQEAYFTGFNQKLLSENKKMTFKANFMSYQNISKRIKKSEV